MYVASLPSHVAQTVVCRCVAVCERVWGWLGGARWDCASACLTFKTVSDLCDVAFLSTTLSISVT